MPWNTESLTTLLQSKPDWIFEVEGDCISVSNDEGIDTFIYAGTKQIIVETALFPAKQIKNTAEFNNLVLRTHQLLPLTTIGIKDICGEEYYVAFGTLSVDSKDSVVIEEIETLFANTDEFLELYEEHLNMEEEL